MQFAVIASAADALQRRKIKVNSVLDDSSKERLKGLLQTSRSLLGLAILYEVKGIAGSLNLDRRLVVPAMALLARGLDDNDASDVQLVAELLVPRVSPEFRAGAVATLARTGRPEVPTLLLANWSSHSSALRSQILDALTSREEWSLALLDAVESGQIPQSQLDARRRQQFLTARNRSVRDKAEKIFAASTNPDRQKLIETYLAAATSSTSEKTRGQVAFAKRCANCHRLAGQGHAVGPDLSPLTNRPAEYLLTSILDPNRAVEDRYMEYVALTTDGRQLTGILLEETGASLTLAGPKARSLPSLAARSSRSRAAANPSCPKASSATFSPSKWPTS
jgi:putative heme-binding domain-containing protein